MYVVCGVGKWKILRRRGVIHSFIREARAQGVKRHHFFLHA